MEINSIQNYYRLQNTSLAGRVKKTAEESGVSGSEYSSDTIAISRDASFKAAMSVAAKRYSAEVTKEASAERITQLKNAYAGDNCPVSGREVAAAVLGCTLNASALR